MIFQARKHGKTIDLYFGFQEIHKYTGNKNGGERR
jgi:hypothetical protein